MGELVSTSMSDAMRAMLDTLMGTDRDIPEEERAANKKNFWDDAVDKGYLCGFSPYTVLLNTKSDLGPNPAQIQEIQMRDEWGDLPQEEKDKYGYEKLLKDHLEQLVSEMDRKILRTKERVETSDPISLLGPEDAERVTDLNGQILELQKKSESLGEEGDIDGSLALHQQAEQLRVQKDDIERAAAPPNEKRQFVCEVSGLIYSSTDNEARIRDLQAGRQYIGYKQIRDKLVELKAKNPPRGIHGYPNEPSRDRSRDRSDRSRADRPERERSPRRDRRDRYDDRDRRDKDRDRDRDRGSRRDRDRDRGHDERRSRRDR